jgi:hypothetical protein
VSLAVPLKAGNTVLDIVRGRTGLCLVSKGRERMRICVRRVRIKHSIRHPIPAIYALRPALEPRLGFATFQFAA